MAGLRIEFTDKEITPSGGIAMQLTEFRKAIGVKPTIKDEDYSLLALKDKPVPTLQKEEDLDTIPNFHNFLKFRSPFSHFIFGKAVSNPPPLG